MIDTAVTGGLAESTANFVAYTLGMGTILIALAVAAALSRAGLYVISCWASSACPGRKPR